MFPAPPSFVCGLDRPMTDFQLQLYLRFLDRIDEDITLLNRHCIDETKIQGRDLEDFEDVIDGMIEEFLSPQPIQGVAPEFKIVQQKVLRLNHEGLRQLTIGWGPDVPVAVIRTMQRASIETAYNEFLGPFYGFNIPEPMPECELRKRVCEKFLQRAGYSLMDPEKRCYMNWLDMAKLAIDDVKEDIRAAKALPHRSLHFNENIRDRYAEVVPEEPRGLSLKSYFTFYSDNFYEAEILASETDSPIGQIWDRILQRLKSTKGLDVTHPDEFGRTVVGYDRELAAAVYFVMIDVITGNALPEKSRTTNVKIQKEYYKSKMQLEFVPDRRTNPIGFARVETNIMTEVVARVLDRAPHHFDERWMITTMEKRINEKALLLYGCDEEEVKKFPSLYINHRNCTAKQKQYLNEATRLLAIDALRGKAIPGTSEDANEWAAKGFAALLQNLKNHYQPNRLPRPESLHQRLLARLDQAYEYAEFLANSEELLEEQFYSFHRSLIVIKDRFRGAAEGEFGSAWQIWIQEPWPRGTIPASHIWELPRAVLQAARSMVAEIRVNFGSVEYETSVAAFEDHIAGCTAVLTGWDYVPIDYAIDFVDRVLGSAKTYLVNSVKKAKRNAWVREFGPRANDRNEGRVREKLVNELESCQTISPTDPDADGNARPSRARLLEEWTDTDVPRPRAAEPLYRFDGGKDSEHDADGEGEDPGPNESHWEGRDDEYEMWNLEEADGAGLDAEGRYLDQLEYGQGPDSSGDENEEEEDGEDGEEDGDDEEYDDDEDEDDDEEEDEDEEEKEGDEEDGDEEDEEEDEGEEDEEDDEDDDDEDDHLADTSNDHERQQSSSHAQSQNSTEAAPCDDIMGFIANIFLVVVGLIYIVIALFSVL